MRISACWFQRREIWLYNEISIKDDRLTPKYKLVSSAMKKMKNQMSMRVKCLWT